MPRLIFSYCVVTAVMAALTGGALPAVAQDVTCNPVLDSRGAPVIESAGGPVTHAGSFPCPPEDEAAAVVEEEPVVVPERRQVFSVSFDFDSDELSPEAMDRLADVAGTVRTYDDPVVTVLGNADQVGATDYNVALSERRANVVANELAANGVEVDAVIGRGDQAPAVDNPDRRPEEMNRQAFVVVRESEPN